MGQHTQAKGVSAFERGRPFSPRPGDLAKARVGLLRFRLLTQLFGDPRGCPVDPPPEQASKPGFLEAETTQRAGAKG